MKKLFTGLLLFVIAVTIFAGENDYLKPLGKPPKAKAQRRQGGESFPPLPLPATPLRRSEKKRPPSPTALIGKVVWGGHLDYQWNNGLQTRVFDWNMVPADCQQLLRFVKRYTKMEYKVQTVDLATFSGVPAEIPILFFSGGRSVKFTPAERAKLRKYLLDGGMVWFDSVVGSPYFYKSALQELKTILPEAPVKRLAPDHPVFRVAKPVMQVTTNGSKQVTPVLDGVYIGSRLAAIVSPYGMGGAWDNVYPRLISDAKFYDRRSSIELGVNIVSYAVGWFENGRAMARGEAYGVKDNTANPDKIVFAQVKTDGIWNSDPGAETRFMRYLSRNVNIDAGAKPVYVDIAGSKPLEDYPFLYLSGIGDFKLKSNEVPRLREYLDNGGFLFVNNSMGLNEFDSSFKQQIRQLYPGSEMVRINSNDPVLARGPFKFNRSGFTVTAAQKFPGCRTPLLYGLRDGDRYKVIYSPVDITGGWFGTSRPGSAGYDSDTALRLGANLVTYFMTH